MSKIMRTRMVKELKTRFKSVKAAVLVDFKGLSAGQADSLRKDLRSANVHMDVLKNSLAKLAFKDVGLDGLSKHLEGAVALVHGADPVTVSKKLLGWKEKNKKLVIKSGILDGEILTPEKITTLSKLAPREVQLATLAGALAAPMAGFAGVLGALTQKMAGLLKALEEKKSKEGGAPAAGA